MQQRLWFMSQLNPNSAAYNLSVALRMRGHLDVRRLSEALDDVIARNEALRTVFGANAGIPYQEIRPSVPVDLPVVELDPADTCALDRALRDLAATPIDITQQVVRPTLLRVASDHHVLSVTLHHLVADGWSSRLFIRGLEKAYRNGPMGESASPLGLRDYAIWEQERLSEAQNTESADFWRAYMHGVPLESRIPGSTVPLHDRSDEGARVPFTLSEQTFGKVKALVSLVGGSTFSFLVAATQLLVARLAAQDDVVIATPMANRGESETRQLVGMLANTVPLRAAFAETTTFREHFADVHQAVEKVKRHQHVPFDRILEFAGVERVAGQQPLCQVMLNLLGTAMPTPKMDGIETELLGQIDTGAAQYDLALHLETVRGNGLRGWFEYRTSRFDEDWAEAIGRRLQVLIESVLAEPDVPVCQLGIVPAVERARLFEYADVVGEEPGVRRLPDLVIEQARRNPGAIALRDDAGELTYSELIEQASSLARELNLYGVGPDIIVGVCAQRSTQLVVALLGILVANGAYLPLDVEHPVRRLAAIVEEAKPRVLLADADQAAKLSAAAPEVRVLPLNGSGSARGDIVAGPDLASSEMDLAYVIYTSGSTGRPKGVAVPHRGIVNRLLWMQDRYGLGDDDVVLQKTPYTFDVSVWEFFWPLMYGATLVMAKPDGHKDPEYLSEIIRAQSVTTVHFVPSMLAAFVDEPTLPQCTSLRRVICSGEALPSALVASFRAAHNADVHNLYGPTEASVDVTHWTCREDDAAPVTPIGRPIANIKAYVLDRAGELAPIGTPGELYLGGVGLARGYLGRPDLTAERFVPDPFASTADGRLYRTGDLARWHPDGYLEFLGRLDHQVKLRGLRIELGEIEASLLEHAAVTEAAVVLRADVGPSPKLAGYFVAAQELDIDQLRGDLTERLPEYMVPSYLIRLPEMPLSSNGKLDRKALPLPELRRQRRRSTTVLSEGALVLREVWAEVLQADPTLFGSDDNFFEHGGDSLQSIRVRALLRERGYDIDVQDMFKAQQLSTMATKIRSLTGVVLPKPVELARPALLPDDVADAYPLSALQAGMIFHSEYAADVAVYQVTFSLQLRVVFERELFQESVDALIRRHDILRTRFEVGGVDGAFQIVQRAASLRVPVQDLRALHEDEQRVRAQAVFDSEQVKPFDLTAPPLLRILVLRRSDDVIDLVVSFHDSIFDGWSAATFLTELFDTYLARLSGKLLVTGDPRARYRDFIAEEQAALGSSDAELFWIEHLKDAVFLRLPRRERDHERISRSIDLPVQVPRALFDASKAFANRIGVTSKTIILTAYIATLAKHGSTSDVLTGLVSGGRPELMDAERVLGQFLNTVPFRARVEGSWTDLAHAVFDSETEIFEHRRYPVVALQRHHHGKPLFETAFNYIHFHVYQRITGRSDLAYLDGQFTDPFHFPLTVNARVHPLTGELAIVANYNTEELDEDQALGFARDMVDALRTMVEVPHALLAAWTGVAAGEIGTAETIEAGTRVAVRADRSAVGVTSSMERDLLQVWESVLDVDGIAVHDDFFDLGGDSILSIQVCARARMLGHAIRPKDLFDNPTVRALAEHVERSGAATHSAHATVLPVRLTPEQMFVLSGNEEPDWDNVSLVLTLSTPLDESALSKAVAAVLDRHESLRTSIDAHADGTWWQTVRAIELGDVLARGAGQDFDSWLARQHRSLDLTAGRVIRIGQHVGEHPRLVLVAHHAIADAASLQVLLADLIEAYTSALAFGHSQLEPGTPLSALVSADEAHEADWTTVLAHGARTLIPDMPGGENTYAEQRTVEHAIDVETTARLIEQARSSRLNLLHLLLGSVGDVLRRRAGRDAVVVDVMTGGRTDVAFADTVGCLAAPVAVVLKAVDPLDGFRAVKSALGRTRGDVRAYLHKRLDPAVEVPDVLVNYLGRFDNVLPDPLVAVELRHGDERAPGRLRKHELEIIALVVDGSLRLRIDYSERSFREETVYALMDELAAHLPKWCAELGEPVAAQAADFPLAKLKQYELDTLLRQLRTDEPDSSDDL
ncbi:amino acid adenylation domain-containing protein [Amycolatopsis sp. NPDC059657]|uniref:non-ribosomal peptide synthetase n=1 Tax=Amycolatopsis sp. NPDC059657 TaxID=3346899 RepID=UPI00366E96FF